jgi:hypothetical protein
MSAILESLLWAVATGTTAFTCLVQPLHTTNDQEQTGAHITLRLGTAIRPHLIRISLVAGWRSEEVLLAPIHTT